MSNCKLSFIFSIVLFICLEIIHGKIYNAFLEKVETEGVNPRYISEFQVERAPATVRGSPYTLSLNFTLLVPVNNNGTIKIESHEYIENKYKRGFIQITKPLCEFFSKDKIIFPILHKNSNLPDKCPVMPDKYIFSNIDAGTSFMMSFVPFRKLRLKLSVYRTDNKENLFSILIFCTYAEKKN